MIHLEKDQKKQVRKKLKVLFSSLPSSLTEIEIAVMSSISSSESLKANIDLIGFKLWLSPKKRISSLCVIKKGRNFLLIITGSILLESYLDS